LISFLGGGPTLALANLVVGAIGFLTTVRLVIRAGRAGSFSAGFPTRRLNIIFATVSVTLYTVQLALATLLLLNQSSTDLIRLTLVLLIGLYGSALARAWEITGIRYRVESKDDAPPEPANAPAQ
jgi:hypothetical protein